MFWELKEYLLESYYDELMTRGKLKVCIWTINFTTAAFTECSEAGNFSWGQNNPFGILLFPQTQTFSTELGACGKLGQEKQSHRQDIQENTLYPIPLSVS